MIYLLEDDDNIRKLINYALNSKNLKCRDFSTPSLFWEAFEKEKPELLLLDIMLPEENGITILKKIRENQETSSIPVIMTTALDSEYDMVSGLDFGADDYITKPFSMMTLVARVKSVLRRYEKSTMEKNTNKLEIGKIIVDQMKHTVFAGKKQIFLTVKEFDLLTLLIKNKDKVLTRATLLNAIWNMDAEIESRTIDAHIKTLRHKLEEYGEYIETIRGVGYKINLI